MTGLLILETLMIIIIIGPFYYTVDNILEENERTFFNFSEVSDDHFEIAATGMLNYDDEENNRVQSMKRYIWYEFPSTGVDVNLLTKVDIPVREFFFIKGGIRYSFFLLLNEIENHTPSLYNYGRAYFLDIANK